MALAFWNANGLKNKKEDLEVFMTRHSLDVVLISEIHLRPGGEARIQNDAFYRFDRTGRKHGGTGIYVRGSLDHYETATPAMSSLEANTIVLNTTFGELRITSVYKPPKAPLVINDLNLLLSFRNPTILAGDFNCKHRS